jgi:hypothetical protein
MEKVCVPRGRAGRRNRHRRKPPCTSAEGVERGEWPAALDPATGQQRWLYDPEVYKAGKPGNSGFIHRGLAYWTDGKIERILHGTNDAYLIFD